TGSDAAAGRPPEDPDRRTEAHRGAPRPRSPVPSSLGRMARPATSRSPRRGAPAPSGIPWHEIRPAPVVLLSGPEQFLADRAGRLLRDQLREQDPGLEVSDVAADAYAPGELLTLASPSLFGEARLIRVTGA